MSVFTHTHNYSPVYRTSELKKNSIVVLRDSGPDDVDLKMTAHFLICCISFSIKMHVYAPSSTAGERNIKLVMLLHLDLCSRNLSQGLQRRDLSL